jgi:hypothetical protein
MSHDDLVQRALRLLAQPIETGKAKEALRQQQAHNPTPTIAVGSLIQWQRADLTMQTGVVDYLHTDDVGVAWAFVTIGEGWAAVNLTVVK